MAFSEVLVLDSWRKR